MWTLARPQNSLPVHVCRPRANSGGSGESSSASGVGQQRVDRVEPDERDQHVLLVGEADLAVPAAVLARERDEPAELLGGDPPDRDAEADRGVLAVGLRR